jgi:VanZ family protein
MGMSTDPSGPDAGDQATPGDLDALRQAWQSLPAAEQAKSLIALYDSYSSKFLSDNARIWTTAATMIPLSLGSFVVLASIRHPSRAQIYLLAAAGWVLMSVWLVIAENHRAFQDGAQKVLRDIEGIWTFPGRPPKSGGSWLLTGPGRVQQMRFVLWAAVTIGAVLVTLFWPGGLLS